MAEETIKKPEPPRVESWSVPRVLRIEGDGFNPRNTKLIDDETGETLKLPAAGIQFNVTADEPNSMVITLCGVELRATVHHVHYEIGEEDLARLARQNGFHIVRAPAYPARIVSYGPAEHQVLFPDLPGLKVTKSNPVNQTTLRMAEEALFAHLQDLDGGLGATPEPSEPREDHREFMVFAHAAPTPDIDEGE